MSVFKRGFFPCYVLLCLVFVLSGPRLAYAFDTTPSYQEAYAVCATDTYGNLLYGENEEVELAPASLTKIMTAMVALDSGIPLDTPIAFIEDAWSDVAQVAGYRSGDYPTFGELLRMALVYSANDAAMNLAYAVAGSQEAFAELMNEKAAELGLEHTHFMNPHGLEEPGHYSCAADLCVMGRYALEHYPFIRQWVHTPTTTAVVNGYEVTFWSTDELMGTYEGLLGIKTGNTESGASFLGAARRGRVTVYDCVLCCPTKEGRFADAASVMDWAFSLYQDKLLVDGSWITRIAPWQDGFWLTCPVRASRTTYGKALPEGEIVYTSVIPRQGMLTAADAPYGTIIWRQGDRVLDSACMRAGLDTCQGSAWSPVMRPIFEPMGA